MEEIGKILPAVFKRQVQRGDAALADVLAAFWPRVVGKAIAQNSRPMSFSDGTLTLAASSPSWAAQLRHLAEDVRAEINSFLGRSVVKKLRVKHTLSWVCWESQVPAHAAVPEVAPVKPPRPAGAVQLDPEMSGIVERSFVKYFTRRGKQVH